MTPVPLGHAEEQADLSRVYRRATRAVQTTAEMETGESPSRGITKRGSRDQRLAQSAGERRRLGRRGTSKAKASISSPQTSSRLRGQPRGKMHLHPKTEALSLEQVFSLDLEGPGEWASTRSTTTGRLFSGPVSTFSCGARACGRRGERERERASGNERAPVHEAHEKSIDNPDSAPVCSASSNSLLCGRNRRALTGPPARGRGGHSAAGGGCGA